VVVVEFVAIETSVALTCIHDLGRLNDAKCGGGGRRCGSDGRQRRDLDLVPLNSSKTNQGIHVPTRLAEPDADGVSSLVTLLDVPAVQLRRQAIGDIDSRRPTLVVSDGVCWRGSQSHHLLLWCRGETG